MFTILLYSVFCEKRSHHLEQLSGLSRAYVRCTTLQWEQTICHKNQPFVDFNSVFTATLLTVTSYRNIIGRELKATEPSSQVLTVYSLINMLM